ncbi:hypothetical protein JCM17845_09480 [Iodidimonas gelatinilytica]|uniref:Alginate lyase n=2 Tax=Iodidimonas gelatinilytica TaxID=1236966 RepID=A0A5A7MY21_9PROT|nr:hypothetical protein JCM17845_09480 [Iodidimonas gelatinilytica]
MGMSIFLSKSFTKAFIGALGYAIAVLPVSAANAENYRVTDQAAYKKAVKALQPGDTLILANGEWRDFEMVFEARGTKDQPITLRAETPGDVIITGRSNLRIGGAYLIVYGLTFKDGYSPGKEVVSFRRDSNTLAHHTRFTENAIIDFNKPDRTSNDQWVALFGKNNRVDHNYFAGKTNKGPTFAVRLNTEESRANNHRIDHNFFGHRPPLGGNGGETIRIGVSDYSRTRSDTLITRNYFERRNGEVEIISVKSEGNRISENVFYESRGAVVLRHGGQNTVSRNVFFGNGVSDTGGIRIINENQTVTGNYFEKLRGTKFLSALTIMNGVPNSAINRYHQVKNALVANNSFLDVASVGFAVGADEERSAPPLDSAFKNNLLVTDSDMPVSVFDDISGISFSENISNNAAFAPYGAAIQPEIDLVRAENGLLYPPQTGKFSSVGAPRDLVPVKRSETGPSWLEKPAQKIKDARVIDVSSGSELSQAVLQSLPGDSIVLSGATYDLEAPLVIDHALTLRGASSASVKAQLKSHGPSIFILKEGARLTLENLVLGATDNNKALLHAKAKNYRGAYSLAMTDIVVAAPAGEALPIPVLDTDAETFAEQITLDHFVIRDWGGPVLSLSGEGLAGWYLADDVTITNSVFENLGGPLVIFGREGRDESTFGPRFSLIGSTLTDVGQKDYALYLNAIDGLILRDNHIVRSGAVYIRRRVLGMPFSIADTVFQQSPKPQVFDEAGKAMDLVQNGAGK